AKKTLRHWCRDAWTAPLRSATAAEPMAKWLKRSSRLAESSGRPGLQGIEPGLRRREQPAFDRGDPVLGEIGGDARRKPRTQGALLQLHHLGGRERQRGENELGQEKR